MPRIGRGVALAALIAIGVLGCGDHSVGPPPTPTSGAVEGVVADVDGNLLGGIGVILVDPENVATMSALVRTDAAGRYRIGGVAPGDYFAFVYNAGKYLAFSRTSQFVHVVAGSTTFQRLTLFDSRFWSNGPLY